MGRIDNAGHLVGVPLGLTEILCPLRSEGGGLILFVFRQTGKVIRSCRLDEVGQLLNVLGGSMSFVGTRPEVPKYVARYTPEMMATLLLPAGVTSEASIRYKDEAELLDKAEDVDETYVQQVLPGKMAYNLASIRRFGLGQELLTMLRTVKAVL